MKKFIYILVAALFAITACNSNDVMEDTRTTSVAPAPGTMVKVEFTVEFPDLPPMTRAEMAENPIINNMYVAVFGEGLYLQHWMPATIETLEAAGSANSTTYSVMLPIVDESRTLHFIANPPADNNPPAFDYEWNIFPNMVTSGTEGAYWQRIELPDGILAKKNSVGDYDIDENGNYLVDPDSVEKLQLVYLVRNYAKIVVNSGSKMFDVGQWTLINYPDRGSVAPYDISVPKVDDHYVFSETYTKINEYDGSDKGDFYEELTGTYIGYMPETAQINHTWPTNPVFANAGGAQYMYERPVPEQYQTSLVAEINWKTQEAYEAACIEAGVEPQPFPSALADHTYWYKIEILDNDGEYIPILRNIQYTININGLNEAGYSSAQAAFNGDYFGNVSSSLETSSLNEISNGVSRIYVDYMDHTFLGGETGQELNYFIVPDDVNAPNVHVTKTNDDLDVKIKVTTKDVAGYANPIDDFTVDYDSGKITFSLNPRTSDLQKGIIRVEGKVGKSPALFREVTINVIGNLVFTSSTAITTTPTTDATDQAVVINIGLEEKLPASLFPIQVRIEAEQNSLSSTSPDLPVANGPSQFTSKSGQNSFYYIYTIDYTSARPGLSYYTIDPATREVTYKTNYSITLYTTKTSGNSTKIHISDMNGYFTPTDLELTI